ncbi:MAG: hypothetical protein ACR2KG_12170 [Nocardioidaceae bacterium]
MIHSTRSLTALLAQRPSQALAGKATALARGADSGSAQRRFLGEFVDTARNTQPPTMYDHPANGPAGHRKEGPLSATELAWLERQFPRDVNPADVSHSDAAALAQLARAVPASKHPADSRLVDAAWQPVKDYHDKQAAKVAASNAGMPMPPIPSSALGAYAEAVSAETPQLRPEEALGRAGQLVRDAAAKREQSRHAALDAARETAAGARPWNRAAVPSADHAGAWGSPAVAP